MQDFHPFIEDFPELVVVPVRSESNIGEVDGINSAIEATPILWLTRFVVLSAGYVVEAVAGLIRR